MTVTLHPNIEAELSAFLRAQPEVVALVADRVYTALPTDVTWPAVRVSQFYDMPLSSVPLWVVETQVQVEAWGGTKAQAFTLAQVIREVCAERLIGWGDVITDVRLSGMQDIPDGTATPARPRWIQVVTVVAHPAK